MGAYKDFDAARAETVEDSLTFRLGGEDFLVPLPLPVMPLFDLAKMADQNADLQALGALQDFLAGMLGDQVQRFEDAARRVRMGLGEFQALVSWMVEESVGRPTGQLSGSPVSASTNTESSPAAA